VAVEVLAAPVVDRRRSRVGVTSSDLDVSERHVRVEGRHDERGSQHVRVHGTEPGTQPVRPEQHGEGRVVSVVLLRGEQKDAELGAIEAASVGAWTCGRRTLQSPGVRGRSQHCGDLSCFRAVIADRPSVWPETQRAFRAAYDRDPTALHRERVRWRLFEANAVPASGGFVGAGMTFAWLVGHLARRRMMNQSPVLAVWPAHAGPDDPATVIFEVKPLPRRPAGDGVLVGQLGQNAALCIEIDGGVVLWPTYNPRKPDWATPTR
jgi:hypothetical protein